MLLKAFEHTAIASYFFKMITLENGYEINPKHKHEHRHTPMDYLQKIIGKFCYKMREPKNSCFLPLHSIVKTTGENRTYGKYHNTVNNIVEELREFNSDLRKIHSNDYLKDEKNDRVKALISSREEYIETLKLGKMTAYLLLQKIDDCKFSDVHSLIFQILFSNKNKVFFEVIKNNQENIKILKEHRGGDIKLYDYDFCKKMD